MIPTRNTKQLLRLPLSLSLPLLPPRRRLFLHTIPSPYWRCVTTRTTRTRTTTRTTRTTRTNRNRTRCCTSTGDGGGCKRRLSSSSSSSSSSSTLEWTACDIVKGPSLLRTTVHRPRPSLLHLPGLRSLPFWTKQQEQQEQQPIKTQPLPLTTTNTSNTSTTTTKTQVAYQDPSLTWVVQHFEQHWETIRDEYNQIAPSLSSDYQVDTEHDQKLHEGSWDWHSYMLKGHVLVQQQEQQTQTQEQQTQQEQYLFGKHFPKTSAILQQVRNKKLLFEQVPFGYTFFSTLHGQSHIASHSAPMNLRIRLHLPLIVPTSDNYYCYDNNCGMNQPTTITTKPTTIPKRANSTAEAATTVMNKEEEEPDKEEDKKNKNKKMDMVVSPCGIRVGPIYRTWLPGHALLFDDSYNHEVWNHTNMKRVVLLVDLWHPDITQQERSDVIAMFHQAKEKGWWTTTKTTTTSTTTSTTASS